MVVFIVPAAFLAHDFWAMPAARQTHETIEFLNNMAIAAGALLVVLHGAGPVEHRCAAKQPVLRARELCSNRINANHIARGE
jgi:hypothetical protein